MKTLKIHLIRHGMTDANLEGRYIGCRTDLPLSPEGFNELRILKERVNYPEAELIYSSPLLRCRQTAAVLYPELGLKIVENLREYDFGEFEGKTASELECHPDFLPWTSGQISAPPDGEDNSEFVKRICVGLNQIVSDMLTEGNTQAAVIMHGGAIMTLLAAAAVPRRHTVEWAAGNGRGYSVLVTPSLYQKSGIIEVYEEI